MRKKLIALFVANEVFALNLNNTYNNRIYRRPTYNPYSNNLYYSPYRYKNTSYNNAKRIQRNNRIRNLNRLRNNLSNWNLNNGFNNGTLTGYSVPINQNVLNFNMDDYNKMTPNCNTNLFSMPTSGGMYYRNGEWFNVNKELSGKTGVRIIYD